MWIPDSTVSKCSLCLSEFSWTVRKHHCRHCLMIYCYKCCSEQKVLKQGEVAQRICNRCRDKFFEMEQEDRSIVSVIDRYKIFDNYLSFEDIYRCLRVNRVWFNYLVRKIKDVRRLPLCQSLTSSQREMIFYHLNDFRFHSRWALLCLREMDALSLDSLPFLTVRKEKPCKLFLCGSDCKKSLDFFDLVEYLCISPCASKYSVEYLLKRCEVTNRKVKILLPLLLQYMSFPLIKDLLIRFSKDYLPYIYWWMMTNDIPITDIQTSLCTSQSEAMDLLFSAQKLGDGTTEKTLQCLKLCVNGILKGNFLNPFDYKVKLVSWVQENTCVISSATRPMFLTFSSDEKKYSYLFKTEDVRKDAIVLSIISLIDSVLKADLKVDFRILTYDVLPMGKGRGLIQIVDNAKTLFEIKHVIQKSPVVWIMNNNPDMTVDEIRKNFIYSYASFSVINYLLGIGDRHLKNIMMTTDGRLFGVDFSFICGDSVRSLLPEIRLSQDLIDIMGGEDSKDFKVFQECYKKIYNTVRKYTGIFSCLLHYLRKSGLLKISEKELNNQIETRFNPGIPDADATFKFVSHIEKDRGTAQGDYLCDLYYYYRHKSEMYLSKVSTSSEDKPKGWIEWVLGK